MLMSDVVKMSNDNNGIESNKEISNNIDLALVSFSGEFIVGKDIGEDNNNNARNANKMENVKDQCTKKNSNDFKIKNYDNDADFFLESESNINGEISKSIIKPTMIPDHKDNNDSNHINENISHNMEDLSNDIDDDCFDDFQAYFDNNQKNYAHSNLTESSHITEQPVLVKSKNNKQNNFDLDQNMDEDFADFASFNANEITDIDETTKTDIAIQSEIKNVDDDFEDFADFTAVEFNTNLELKSPSEVDNMKNSSKIEFVNHKSLIQDAFPIIISDNLLSSNKNDDVFINVFDDRICADNARQLWNNLQKIDFNRNFSFDKWKRSTTFRHLLKSLKIDSCNVITENVFLKPIFLNQILEPTNYDDTSNLNFNINATSPDSNLKSLDVFLSKTSHLTSIDNYQSLNWLENSQQSTSTSFFDNLSQDLDFFETKYVNNKNNNSSLITDDLIAEFDEILIDNLNKNPSKTNINKQADIGVLPKEETESSPVKRNTEQVLSAEALRILTELPNLSMMRQKFQIKVDQHRSMSNNN